ncbi:methylmalonate-semialdehyde dehydrogenase (CoA acylating) [Photobacterium leiognathi]|uniref:methylmalonate-semialdehyde dehydrogenase (CoA acylating) n=1 Tax=Photobacterium leiognathi TaxID=553611 RepID=A0ABX5GKX7_PHOLE|nr:CoA-acylating methylmalonate-semialdehyde dehydrogenase [Photobacterium leiognathi]KJF91722.1 methylmalonate-semialdehyde dehydrogenase [Photobacterium leiognathi]PSV86363.1 methylmalonate-semialdehyde dehydrogenase (CoA acylating) [Photobacterium leiognathi]
MKTVGHLINGQLVEHESCVQDVFNPATGEPSKQVSLATKSTVEEAISCAQAAYPAWRNTPPIKRARIMFRFKSLLEEHAERICKLVGEEHGKVRHDAAGELQRAIENVEFACGIPELLKGEHTKNVAEQIDSWSEFHPLGVVAGITPFNFPVMVPMWMFPLAIACGNTFILKPSERVPSATLYVANLLHEAGLPDGVLNVVNGDKETVDVLLSDKRIKAISFVGSTPIAQSIYTAACLHGKRCQALGGAKNHAVLMPDADIDNAVNQLLGAAFGSSGERCMALSVVVAVGDSVADSLVKKMCNEMQKLKVGAYDDNGNDFGPVISQAHKQKVLGYIDSAEADGATVVVDGRNVSVSGYEKGFFVGATLLDHVTTDMQSYQKEIFGPVMQVVRVQSMEDAITLIDNHEYGNGTCVFTRDGEAARYFSDNIEVGMVGINVPLPVPVAYHSFGGWKHSLFGDLHAYGPDGVKFYTKRKTITQRWPSSGVREGVSFSFPS